MNEEHIHPEDLVGPPESAKERELRYHVPPEKDNDVEKMLEKANGRIFELESTNKLLDGQLEAVKRELERMTICHDTAHEQIRMTLESESPFTPRFECVNRRYFVVVQRYIFNQFRLQLCDRDKRSEAGYDGAAIVREMCTYLSDTALKTTLALMDSHDPAVYAEQTLARSWNCEYPGGRIRLDNQNPADREVGGA